MEFHVADCRDQIKTQPQAFTAISIALTQNMEDFQSANDVLNKNTFAR